MGHHPPRRPARRPMSAAVLGTLREQELFEGLVGRSLENFQVDKNPCIPQAVNVNEMGADGTQSYCSKDRND